MIDEIIDVINNSGYRFITRWDPLGYRNYVDFLNYTQHDWNQTLVTRFNEMCHYHHSVFPDINYHNYIFGYGPTIMEYIFDIDQFLECNTMENFDQTNVSMSLRDGFKKIGSLSYRYSVFVTYHTIFEQQHQDKLILMTNFDNGQKIYSLIKFDNLQTFSYIV